MRRGAALIVLAVTLTGCAAVSRAATATLTRADEELAARNYQRALQLYDQFLAMDQQTNGATPRVRATRAAVARLIESEADLERLRKADVARQRAVDEVDRLKTDLDRVQAERERLKAETDRLKAERERLRTDLERLRSIDIREAPRR